MRKRKFTVSQIVTTLKNVEAGRQEPQQCDRNQRHDGVACNLTERIDPPREQYEFFAGSERRDFCHRTLIEFVPARSRPREVFMRVCFHDDNVKANSARS